MNLNNPSMHYRVQNEYYKFLDQQGQLFQAKKQCNSNIKQQQSSQQKVKQMTSKSNQTIEEQQIFSDYELPPPSHSMMKNTFNHFLNYQKRIPAQPMFKSTLFKHAVIKYIPKLDSRIHSSATWRSKLNDKQQNYQKIPYKGKFFLSPNHSDAERKKNQLQVTNSKKEDLFSREQIQYLQSETEGLHNIKSTKSDGKKKFQIISYTKNIQARTQRTNDDDDTSETDVIVFTSKKKI